MESSSNGQDDDNEDSDTIESGDYHAQVQQDIKEHNTLWQHEGELRYRTAGLTGMERKHLYGMDHSLAARLEHAMKYQEPMPVAAVWLNNLINDEGKEEGKEYVKGQSIIFPSAAWSLAKCQLVQQRLASTMDGHGFKP